MSDPAAAAKGISEVAAKSLNSRLTRVRFFMVFLIRLVTLYSILRIY